MNAAAFMDCHEGLEASARWALRHGGQWATAFGIAFAQRGTSFGMIP